MNKSVVIVAGGSGLRMGSEVPKQFILIAKKPVLMWSISCFLQYDTNIQIVVVLPESQIPLWEDLCNQHSFHIKHMVVKGGETRFHSVKNGLHEVFGSDLTAIHDGVRPLVSQPTIHNCFEQAAKTGAAIPVLPVNETLRKGSMGNSVSVDRSNFYTVQTPQIFRTSILIKAYQQEWNSSFTDDASVVEKQGFPVVMVPGNPENLKITHPLDLLIATEYLKKKKDTL